MMAVAVAVLILSYLSYSAGSWSPLIVYDSNLTVKIKKLLNKKTDYLLRDNK